MSRVCTMDPVLPFRILSPGSRKPKFNHRAKESKLSLKSGKGTRVDHSLKENRDPLFNDRKNQKKFGLRFEDSDLMTSDESDNSDERCSQPHSVMSINTQESTFSQPVAESTRCEIMSSKVPFESTIATLHTASNGSTSSASTEYYTACPLPVGCDESIVCISDSSPEPERRVVKAKGRLSVSVLISSDESDNEQPNASKEFTIKKKLCETVNLDSSSSDVNYSDNEDVVIPPSEKGSTSSAKSSKGSDMLKVQPGNDIIIPPSPDKLSQSDIISEDSHSEKNLSNESSKRRMGQLPGNSNFSGASCDRKRNFSKPSSSPKQSPPCDLNESSWKEDFRLVLPDSQSHGSEKDFQSIEIDFRANKPNKVTQTISNEKYNDIARWIIGGRTTSESSSDNLSHPKSLGNETESSPSIHDSRTGYPQSDRLPTRRRISVSSDSEDDDNFQALIESVRKKRLEGQKKISIKDDSFIDDSFIDDNCQSDVAESPSLNVYHAELTKSIKTEVKSVRKTVQSIKKKQVFRNFYDSDESDYEASPDNKPNPCSKSSRKAIEFPSDSEDSVTDFEISSKGGKTSSIKEPDSQMKQNVRHPKSSSKIKALSGQDKNSDSNDSDSQALRKSKELRWRKTVNPSSNSSDSSNSASSEVDLPKKTSKKTHKEKPSKSSTVTTPCITPRNVAALKTPGKPYSPIRTFLSSLSGPTHEPGVRDHPEAAVYNKNFKGKKEELTRRLFKLFNREVFDKRLPDDMLLEWNARLVRTAGLCYCKLMRKDGVTTRTSKIGLSTKVITSPDRLRDTLIHEMCHAAVWLLNNVSGGHGPFWKAWAHKAMKRFPELPPIERCHTYNIETKYTYKCTKCGYSFGRHSKSLDLDKKRCGYCYGRFEVFLSSQVKVQNNQEQVVKTPRTPNAFALFVKENYKTVKEGNAQLKHGDIMKKLGENFASMKVKSSD